MGTLTEHMGFMKPTITADSSTWGDDYSSGDPLVDPSPGLNGNWEKIDQLIQVNEDAIAAMELAIANVPDQINALRIPVGGLHVSTSSENPATKLGYGTWVAWGEGRALAGVGNTVTAGQEFGEDAHALTEAEIPSHTHSINFPLTNTGSDGAHTHNYTGHGGTGQASGSSGTSVGAGNNANTTNNGNHTHSVDIAAFDTTSVGSDTPHNNVQPSQAAYIWKRTA